MVKKVWLVGVILTLLFCLSIPGSTQTLNKIGEQPAVNSLGEGIETVNDDMQQPSEYLKKEDLSSQRRLIIKDQPAPQAQETQNTKTLEYPEDPNFPKLFIFLYRNEYMASPLHRSLASRGGNRTKYYLNISPIILKYAKLYNLDPYLIKGIIQAESGFYNYAVSCHGAQGLMQLIPSTGAYMGAKNLFDPEENIAAGCKYMREMLNIFGNVETALAAYNAGPGTVKRNGAPAHSIRYARQVLKYARE
jgi:hypothetical protein